LVNLRDLGGIAVTGGHVRPGRLWRSDDVSTVTHEQADRLVHAGLTTVIDLRSPVEASVTGRGPLGTLDVQYHHLPLTDDLAAPGATLTASSTAVDVGEWYALLVLSKAPTLVRALAIIAESAGATVFHCAAGKDRTGILAASVLTVLGATPAAVIDDYHKTDAAMPAVMARLLVVFEPLFRQSAIVTAGSAPTGGALLGADVLSMSTMLEVLEQSHGGLVAILAGAGLTPELQQNLVARSVSPGDGV
jgi:hypothetical protein